MTSTAEEIIRECLEEVQAASSYVARQPVEAFDEELFERLDQSFSDARRFLRGAGLPEPEWLTTMGELSAALYTAMKQATVRASLGPPSIN